MPLECPPTFEPDASHIFSTTHLPDMTASAAITEFTHESRYILWYGISTVPKRPATSKTQATQQESERLAHAIVCWRFQEGVPALPRLWCAALSSEARAEFDTSPWSYSFSVVRAYYYGYRSRCMQAVSNSSSNAGMVRERNAKYHGITVLSAQAFERRVWLDVSHSLGNVRLIPLGQCQAVECSSRVSGPSLISSVHVLSHRPLSYPFVDNVGAATVLLRRAPYLAAIYCTSAPATIQRIPPLGARYASADFVRRARNVGMKGR